MHTPYLNLARQLAALSAVWDRQDAELADARAGLDPMDRVNEAEIDAALQQHRDVVVREMIREWGL